MLSETNERGVTTAYDYDERYLRTRRVNGLNDAYVWQYDANGNLTSEIDEEGRTTRYEYDRQNRRTAMTQPEGHSWAYEYDANGNQTKVTDPWGYVTETTYDGVNQPNSITTPDGPETVSYTLDGQLAYRSDTEGRRTEFHIAQDNLIVKQVDAVGRETSNTYDNNGNITNTVLTWSNTYNGPTSSETTFAYDALDRVTNKTEGNGIRSITYAYDAMGNLLNQTYPNGRVTRYTYDELDRQVIMTDAYSKTTRSDYDGVGNLTQVENRRGNSTQTTYDPLNRPTQVRDALNQTQSMTYDKVGNLLTETDKRGTATTHVYDSLNRLISSTKDNIRLVFNEYNVAGLNNQDRQDAVTDANDNRVVSQFNWRGQVTRTEFPDNSFTEAEYDRSGFQTAVRDELSYQTTFTYFDDGNVQTQTNAESEATNFRYDLFSKVVLTTKPLGNSTESECDALGRMVKVTDALGQESRFEYDANDNLINQYTPAAADSGSSRVEYRYDLLNRKTQHIQHKSGGNLTTQFTYDENGNITQIRDAKGQVFGNTYDALDRLTTQTIPGNDISTIVSTYDPNNNLDTVTENKSSGIEVTDHGYDRLDRLISVDQRGHSISYAYDDNGNRTQVTSAGGSTTYDYDDRNRLISAQSPDGTTQYSYFANGWQQTVSYPNTTSTRYTYDQVGRVDTITNQANNAQLSSFDYAYDDNGNRTEQIEIQNGFSSNKQQTTTYTFDELDRMASYSIADLETGNVTTTTYTFYPSYDRRTELVTETQGGTQTTTSNREYRYDETYWLTRITDQDSGNEITYAYDANGNTLSKRDNTDSPATNTVFTYNSRNYLVQAQRGPPGNETGQGTYDYDYRGMRIRHLGSERGNVEYIYDDRSILEEVTNNTSNLIAHYRYADRLLSLTTPSETQYYHYASLGTVANLTAPNGSPKVSYRTDPYGEITQQEGESVNRQVFTGQEHDEQTGLIYFGARFYDPDTARFITQDTYLGEPGTPPSLHRYLYAYGNPTVWVDPTGNVPVLDPAGEYLMKTGDNLLKEVDEDSSALSTAFFGVTAGASYLIGGVVETVNFGLNILGGAGYLGSGAQERSSAELEEAFGTIKTISENKAEVASNVVETIGTTVEEAAAGNSKAQANVIAAVTGFVGGGGAGATGKLGQGVNRAVHSTAQVTKQIAKSKVVSNATATVERMVKSGGNRVAEIGNSAVAGMKESFKQVAELTRNWKSKNYVLNMQKGDFAVDTSVKALRERRNFQEIGLDDISNLRKQDKLTIVAHGSPELVAGEWTGEQLGRLLMGNKFKAKEIDLFACNTALGCIPEQIANITKAKVRAPEGFLNLQTKAYPGMPRVRPAGDESYMYPNTGFRTVKPGQTRPPEYIEEMRRLYDLFDGD